VDIVETLSRINRWWGTGKVDKNFLYPAVRREFQRIITLLGQDRILSIIGPRRSGKSVLLTNTIDYLLKQGVCPQRILFLSGDDPALFAGIVSMGDVLEKYANDVIHESFNELTSKIYILIDEVHALPDWQVWLKSYYDRRLSIKFIVSGSSATHLFQGSKESLLGRIESIHILPLSFRQFCYFWSVYKHEPRLIEFIQLLPDGNVFSDPAKYYHMLDQNRWKWETFKPLISGILKEYLLVGGYPEYFTTPNIALWQKRLIDDIIGQGLYRDIINVYHIKNPERLESLLFFVAANTGQDFNYKTIADTLSCDNETVSVYLSFLKQAYLVIINRCYTPNVGKSIRKNKKLYVYDNGIANAMLHYNVIDSAREGLMIENCCLRDALQAVDENRWSIGYYREAGYEIDMIIDKKTSLLPIEVKFRREVDYVPAMGIFKSRFSQYQVTNGLVITKDTLLLKENLYLIPYWLL